MATSSAPAAVSPLSSPPIGPLPKAVLYASDLDPWSSAVLLTLEEKGYGHDDVDISHINPAAGQSFDLSYLKISGKGIVPTLVVPVDRFLGSDIESRYKAMSDIIKILEFLDKSRTIVSKTHSTSTSPAPALAPATIDASSNVNVIIKAVHAPEVDLELLYISAISVSEIEALAEGPQAAYLHDRSARINVALHPPSAHTQEHSHHKHHKSHHEAHHPEEDVVPVISPLNAKSKAFLEGKLALYNKWSAAYAGQDRDEFLAASKNAWEVDVKATLSRIEDTIKLLHIAAGEESAHDYNHSEAGDANMGGRSRLTSSAGRSKPGDAKQGGLILGEHPCLADLHLFPWLARLVYLSGGDLTIAGLTKLDERIGGGVGERVRGFWEAMLERESVKKVYKGRIH